ncbi:MAG: hypothetical protein JSR11_12125 [Bacteroidetes bacterium]|nr:hypothetical protein [Bacteroidota bacterium]
MTTERDYLICLLDVLGFENLFNRFGLQTIEAKYKELIEVADKHNFELALMERGGVPVMGNPGIKSSYFSDTILFWCPYDDMRMEVLFDSLAEVMCKSIEIGLPLRGAVSVGQVVIEKEKGVYLGQPFISAARAEIAQKWIVITLSKTFDLPKFNGGFKADKILEYKKHIKQEKSDKVIPLVIDYPRKWRKTRTSSLVDAIIELNTDEQFSDYYLNTIEFVNYSTDNHDWWKNHPSFLEELERQKRKHDDKQTSR